MEGEVDGGVKRRKPPEQRHRLHKELSHGCECVSILQHLLLCHADCHSLKPCTLSLQSTTRLQRPTKSRTNISAQMIHHGLANQSSISIA